MNLGRASLSSPHAEGVSMHAALPAAEEGVGTGPVNMSSLPFPKHLFLIVACDTQVLLSLTWFS